MKIRLTQPGFDNYNGQMGVVFFEAGLSLNDVSVMDAVRMSAVMRCEWEDGTSPSIAQSLLDNANTPAPIFTNGDGSQHDKERKTAESVAVMHTDKPKTSTYSREQLGAIADKDGIKGLRAIAEPLGIKGASIKELIDAVLKSGAHVDTF